jgi:hypothetical protein
MDLRRSTSPRPVHGGPEWSVSDPRGQWPHVTPPNTPSRYGSARRSAALAALLLVGTLASAPFARADRASAEAALPADGVNPFFTVTTTTTTSSEWDDLPRLPEYCVYPNGTFLVQKSDERLWSGRLTRDQVLELVQFLLDDARLPTIDMTYILSSPLTTFRRYTLTTRNGTWSVRRRASGGFGTGVREGERALNRIDRQLFQFADRANQPFVAPGLFVVARRITDDPALPVWTWNDKVPFATFAAAADVDTRGGAVVAGEEAKTVAAAVQQGASWRFGGVAATFRSRPALPHEVIQPAWRAPDLKPDGPAPAPDGTPPVATGPGMDSPSPEAPTPAAPMPTPAAPSPEVPAEPPPTPPVATPLPATPPTVATPPAATPTAVGPVRVLLVGTDEIDLGPTATAEAGESPPSLYVARDAATWKAIFDERLTARGPTGVACAKALQPIRDAAAAHDFSTGPLVLLLGPVTSNYGIEVAPNAEVLPDGTARVVVAHRHDPKAGPDAAARRVRWTLHRAEGQLPTIVLLRANGRDVPAP